MFYRFAWRVCRTFLILVRRMEVLGLENVPAQGGLVLVSNHRSYWDPVIVGCALPQGRQIFFMAKDELFKVPLLKTAITWLGAFPVRRSGANREAIRTALHFIAGGRVVGIFPEGTRNKENGLLEPQIGMALLSTKAAAPVLPIAVLGAKGLFGKVTVNIGPVIHTTQEYPDGTPHKYSREELIQLSAMIMDKISILLERMH